MPSERKDSLQRGRQSLQVQVQFKEVDPSIDIAHTPALHSYPFVRTIKDQGWNSASFSITKWRCQQDVFHTPIVEDDEVSDSSQSRYRTPETPTQPLLELAYRPRSPITLRKQRLESLTPSRPPSRSRLQPLLLPTRSDVSTTFINGIGELTESPEQLRFGFGRPFSESSPPPTPQGDSPIQRRFTYNHTPPSSPLSESGHHSARGWHSTTPRTEAKPPAKDILQRYIPSSRPGQGITGEEAKKGQSWTAFVEDEDELSVLPRMSPSGKPSGMSNKQSRCQDVNGLDHPPCLSRVDEEVLLPLRLTLHAECVDIRNLPSSSLCSSERRDHLNSINDRCKYFLSVFRDEEKYEEFLQCREDSAQYLLDALQALLDESPLDDQARLTLRVGLVRLTRKSALYPQSFNLFGVTHKEYPITSGSFGTVYEGLFQGRPVGVKVIRMQSTEVSCEQALKALMREAVLWGQLTHPNVLPFLGISHLNGAYPKIGLISPWMQNGSVHKFLQRHPTADRFLLASDVAAGVLYLHKNGVVHGDLHPENILVNDSQRACLTDFGLSTVTDADGLKGPLLSSSNLKHGAFRFLAPELSDPDKNYAKSTASDVYALSMVYHQMFTGRLPFDKKKAFNVPILVIKGARPLRPDGSIYEKYGLTDMVWELMEECWRPTPESRPDASEIVKRLSQEARVDYRPNPGWGNLSSSQFRLSNPRGLSYKDTSSIDNLRRVLEVPITRV